MFVSFASADFLFFDPPPPSFFKYEKLEKTTARPLFTGEEASDTTLNKLALVLLKL